MTALALAGFDRADAFARAIARLRADERRIAGIWSPLPVAGIDDPAAARGIVPVAAIVGIGAAVALYLLEYLSAVYLYPFDSGARPLHSWQAFLIAPIEFGALAAAIGGAAMFLRRARLPLLHAAAFDIAEVEAASRDRFVVAVRCDPGADAGALLTLLVDAGAVHSRLVTP